MEGNDVIDLISDDEGEDKDGQKERKSENQEKKKRSNMYSTFSSPTASSSSSKRDDNQLNKPSATITTTTATTTASSFSKIPILPFYLTTTRLKRPPQMTLNNWRNHIHHYNYASLSIKDCLQGAFTKLVIFNFLVDLDWLTNEVPRVADPQVEKIVISGIGWEEYRRRIRENDSCRTGLGQELGTQASVRLGREDWKERFIILTENFSVHHTKLFLVFYPNGLRFIMTTANLRASDWECKSNCVVVQDFPLLRQAGQDFREGLGQGQVVGNGLKFMNDLLYYLEVGYNKAWVEKQDLFLTVWNTKRPNKFPNDPLHPHPLQEVLPWIRGKYDFSDAFGTLIASIPGRYKAGSFYKYGHLKLRHELSSPVSYSCENANEDENESKNESENESKNESENESEAQRKGIKEVVEEEKERKEEGKETRGIATEEDNEERANKTFLLTIDQGQDLSEFSQTYIDDLDFNEESERGQDQDEQGDAHDDEQDSRIDHQVQDREKEKERHKEKEQYKDKKGLEQNILSSNKRQKLDTGEDNFRRTSNVKVQPLPGQIQIEQIEEIREEKIIAQFSSIGTLNKWFEEQLVPTLCTIPGNELLPLVEKQKQNQKQKATEEKAAATTTYVTYQEKLHLIWPSRKNVYHDNEEIPGSSGSALCCNQKNMYDLKNSDPKNGRWKVADLWIKHLRKWDGINGGHGRQCSLPHLKTYMRVHVVSKRLVKKKQRGQEEEEQMKKPQEQESEVRTSKSNSNINMGMNTNTNTNTNMDMDMDWGMVIGSTSSSNNINNINNFNNIDNINNSNNTILASKEGLLEVSWYYLTSSNLSWQAHGRIEKFEKIPTESTQFHISHYELGILFRGPMILERQFSVTPTHPVLGLDHHHSCHSPRTNYLNNHNNNNNDTNDNRNNYNNGSSSNNKRNTTAKQKPRKLLIASSEEIYNGFHDYDLMQTMLKTTPYYQEERDELFQQFESTIEEYIFLPNPYDIRSLQPYQSYYTNTYTNTSNINRSAGNNLDQKNNSGNTNQGPQGGCTVLDAPWCWNNY